MATQLNYFQGDTWNGTVQLRTQGVANPATQNPYPFPAGATATILLPGGVMISSATPLPMPLTGFEIMPVSGSETDLAFTVTPDKSVLVTSGKNQAVDTVVTDSLGNVTTFEVLKSLNVFTRAN